MLIVELEGVEPSSSQFCNNNFYVCIIFLSFGIVNKRYKKSVFLFALEFRRI